MTTRRIPWHKSKHGGPLGRHVEHDPRSRQFTVSRASGTRDPIKWQRHGKILDQGNLGSCTGNALVGALETEPIHHKRERWNERKAVKVYGLATELDEFEGTYPPTDTGSSGLAACKAAVKLGWITRYEHAFGIEQALDALQCGPVITGIDWYEGFDRPDEHGYVQIAGEVRGGHEIVVRGYTPTIDPLDARVWMDNSWGHGWGRHGSFTMSVRTWGTLLEMQGDVTIPLR